MGSVRGNFSPPAYERAEQLGIVEGSEDWVSLEGGQAPQGWNTPAILRVLGEVGSPALRGRVASWGLSLPESQERFSCWS